MLPLSSSFSSSLKSAELWDRRKQTRVSDPTSSGFTVDRLTGLLARGARWPLDPPPVIEFTLHDNDHAKRWLHSPYWFCTAGLEPLDGQECKTDLLTGCLSSSLHKVKLSSTGGHRGRQQIAPTVTNSTKNMTEAGFFVFGDLNAKYQGTFRLVFTVFEMRQT